MTGTAVLIKTDPIRCTHPTPGKVTTTAAEGRLKVAGVSVLLVTDVAGRTVACTANDPSHGIKQCTSVTSVTAGKAGKLTVGHTPVLLASLTGVTDGSPPGTIGLTATAGQRKLTAGAAG